MIQMNYGELLILLLKIKNKTNELVNNLGNLYGEAAQKQQQQMNPFSAFPQPGIGQPVMGQNTMGSMNTGMGQMPQNMGQVPSGIPQATQPMSQNQPGMTPFGMTPPQTGKNLISLKRL